MKVSFSIVIFILLTAACTSKQASTPTDEGLPYFYTADFTPIWITEKTQLDTLHTISDFEFTNQNNQKITIQNLKGKIHVANFFFTICPSLCPKIMGNMKQVQQAFKTDKNVVIASYSVMPDRDSVPVLREYANKNNIMNIFYF